VAAQQHDGAISHRVDHLLRETTIADEHASTVHGNAASGEPRTGNIEGSHDRPDLEAGKIRRDCPRRVRMHDRANVCPAAQHLCMQRKLVRHRPAVELTTGAFFAIQVNEPDVVRGCVSETLFVRPPASHENQIVVHEEADMAEDSVGKTATCENPARP